MKTLQLTITTMPISNNDNKKRYEKKKVKN